MRTPLAALVSVALLASCGSSASEAPAPEPTQEPDPGPSMEALAPRPADDQPAATEPAPALSIGWAEIPEGPEATRTAVRAALRQHSAGDHAASRAAFQAIVDAHPSRDIVRFNLACAMSLTHSTADSAAQLRQLLTRDLATYRARLETDEDLALLRESEHMAELEALIETLEPQYMAAAQRGVPMYAHAGGLVRAGVWLDQERRFVPLGPRISGASAALIDVELDAAITISSHPEGDDCETESCGSLRIHRHRLVGGPPTVEHSVPAIDIAFHALEDGGVRFRWDPGGMSAPVYGQRWEEITPGQEEATVSESRDSPERAFVMSGELHAPHFSRSSYAERRWGNSYIVRQNRLFTPGVPEPIELTAGHAVMHTYQSLAVVEDRVAIVASSTGTQHLIDRVDLTTRTVAEPMRGEGRATVRRDARGDVWLQVGAAVRRMPDPMAAFEDGDPPILAGVTLDR